MTQFAIASPHHLATQAGQDAFRAGGTAVDAAIAAAAVLTVVYPNNVALGGDLVALVRTPDGAVHCVNATGPAPAAQSLERLRRVHGDELPLRHIDTVSVPGGVRGWAALRTFGARLGWAGLFAAAVRHAEQGVLVARSVGASIAEKRDVLAADPGCAEVFLPGGVPLATGDLLVQPALARTLAELRDGGPDAFYTGPLGRRLVAGLAGLGSLMTPDDLATFEPEITEPLSGAFRDHTVFTSPPNTQGFSLLRALDRVRRLGDPGDLLAAGAGRLAAVFEESNAVRDLSLADPRFAKVDADELISRDLGPGERPQGPVRAGGDTVGISAIDSDGYAVSLIQSVFNSFGAAVLEPSTGVLMQNRGRSFSLTPGDPNVFEPGKRPRHTLMPVLVTKDGEIAWVSSTMGGHGQPQIHAQLLLRSMAGEPPAQAVDAPRWIVGVQESGDTARTVYLEDDVPAEAARSLAEHGFVAKPVPPHDEWLGHANLIAVAPDGTFTAASDPRADGSAAVGRT